MGDKALLLALGYPRAQAFNHADPQSLRNLVVWLENVKVCSVCQQQQPPGQGGGGGAAQSCDSVHICNVLLCCHTDPAVPCRGAQGAG